MADSPLAAWLRDQEPHQSRDPDREQQDVAEADPVWPGAALSWDVDLDPEPVRKVPVSRWLLLAATLPWVVAAALAFAAARGPDPQSTLPQPTPSPSPSPSPSPVPPAEDEALTAAGALFVRSALSGPVPGARQRTRYVEAVVPTGAQRLGDVTVVSVLALVLEGTEEGWEAATTRRLAVAVLTGQGGPVLAGGPWSLPDPPPALADGAAELADPERRTGATDTLEAAGYDEVGDLRLQRDPGLPGVLLARGDARPPGADTRVAVEVWLSDEPVPQLLGTP